MFKSIMEDGRGLEVFVTSLTGDSVRIYPLRVWIDIERKLLAMPENHPSRLKFLDRVNYYGQSGELDGQGRVVIPAHLRESAAIVGDVRVLGRISYLEVWNGDRIKQKLQREAWTDEDGLRMSEHGI